MLTLGLRLLFYFLFYITFNFFGRREIKRVVGKGKREWERILTKYHNKCGAQHAAHSHDPHKPEIMSGLKIKSCLTNYVTQMHWDKTFNINRYCIQWDI